jgi:hypothetical protein
MVPGDLASRDNDIGPRIAPQREGPGAHAVFPPIGQTDQAASGAAGWRLTALGRD